MHKFPGMLRLNLIFVIVGDPETYIVDIFVLVAEPYILRSATSRPHQMKIHVTSFPLGFAKRRTIFTFSRLQPRSSMLDQQPSRLKLSWKKWELYDTLKIPNV